MAGHVAAQDQRLVSNVFLDSDLRQALSDVAAQAGVNIIADPSVQGLVSVELKDSTVEKALELLLAGTGFHYLHNLDYYLVYGTDETAPGFTEIAETRRVQVYYLPAPAARSLLPSPLQRYVRADETADILAVTAPPQLLDRILADIAVIDVQSTEDARVVPLGYTRAATARRMLPESLQRYVRADEERNTLAITAPYGALQNILAQIALIDAPRDVGAFNIPDVYPTHLVKLNHTTAATVLALLPPALKDYVRADDTTNTVAIAAPDVMLNGIFNDVAAIDVPRKHVMLNARVEVLERGDLLDFGADWKWPTISAGAGISNLGPAWEVRIGYSPDREFTNALSLTLNLLSQNNEATIIASPQVLAEDGRPAQIKVTTEEYFQITQEGVAGAFLRSELQQIETGTILNITPRVGRNNEMNLDINIEVSDVVARGAQNLPVVSRRTAQSTVRINNGGTAAVAGLVDTRSQLGRSGVPGSLTVPLLGRAFRTDKLNHQARQVAVFITATVVETGDELAETGRSRPPPPVVALDDEAFRRELAGALDRLATPR